MTQTPSLIANPYLTEPVPKLFLKTATPIILIMLLNGLFTVIDAIFLGIYVGANALTAVTLMFPVFMLIVGLSTLVGSGTASILARQLGAKRVMRANQTLMSAHILTFLISIILIVTFLIYGKVLISTMANHDAELTSLGYCYIAPLIYCSPLALVLTLQSDALRSEGRVGWMALIAISATLLNILFNYLLIKVFLLGVLGSALGTVCAQLFAVIFVIGLRINGKTQLTLLTSRTNLVWKNWGEILSLGIPASLNFVGISIIASTIIISLQTFAADTYSATVAAYGVMTRIGTFAFLPLMGFTLATQSIVGNNIGAKKWRRVNTGLKMALIVTLVYTLLIEFIFISNANVIGALFVKDPLIISEVGRILPITMSTFFMGGQVLILAGYFQAKGDVAHAMIFGLFQTYLLTIPITLCLPYIFSKWGIVGEWGIWFATPTSSLLMLFVSVFVLRTTAKKTSAKYGVFYQPTK